MESILSHKVGGGWGTAICANEHPTDPCGPNSVRTKYQPQVLCNRSATHGRGAKLKGEVKAIRVPRGGNDKISPQVFSFCTEIRHVVESGVKIVGEAAWEAVNSANRPLARQSSAITWRRQTPRVVAPGCKHFGLKYSKSVAPQRGWIRLNAQQSASLPSPSEVSSFSSMHSSESHQFRHARAGCSAHKPMLAGLLSGIVALALPTDFNRMGSAACASCQQLQTVDLSQADVLEILGSAFAHCSQLQQLCLSRNLRIIKQEAFLKCTSLRRFPLHHPCFTLRDALLQVARNFEQYASKEKVKHGEGHISDPMPLTNVSNSISPNGSDFLPADCQ